MAEQPNPVPPQQSAGTHLRVSLMPWNNTSGTATSGVIIIALIIALPIIIGVSYMIFGDKSADTGRPTPAAPQR
jgi:hypothetical protein